jgi:hypothetical protein
MNREALDMEALTNLGKTYDECTPEERDAVEHGVLARQLIDPDGRQRRTDPRRPIQGRGYAMTPDGDYQRVDTRRRRAAVTTDRDGIAT